MISFKCAALVISLALFSTTAFAQCPNGMCATVPTAAPIAPVAPTQIPLLRTTVMMGNCACPSCLCQPCTCQSRSRSEARRAVGPVRGVGRLTGRVAVTPVRFVGRLVHGVFGCF